MSTLGPFGSVRGFRKFEKEAESFLVKITCSLPLSHVNELKLSHTSTAASMFCIVSCPKFRLARLLSVGRIRKKGQFLLRETQVVLKSRVRYQFRPINATICSHDFECNNNDKDFYLNRKTLFAFVVIFT